MAFTFDPESSYVMPAHFGPRPVSPKASGWYHDVTAMTVPYLTDRDRLAELLPAPFEVADEPWVSVFYARNRQVDWLAGHGYNMVAVNAAATFDGREDHLHGQFTLVMWENLADPILSGRELQGIPKIFADIPDHTVIGGELRATASHFGHPIVELAVSGLRAPTADEIAAGLAEQAGRSNMAYRYLPGVSGFGTAVSEATVYPSTNELRSVRVGEGRVQWQELTWEQNPTQFHIVNTLHRLPVLEYGPAVVTEGRTNLILLDDLPRTIS